MQSLISADIICILFLIVVLISLISKKDKSKSSRYLAYLCGFTIINLLFEALRYIVSETGTPDWIVISIWNISIFTGTMSLIFFVHYCQFYISEKTPVNKWYFYIPLTVLTIITVYTIILGCIGKIITIEEGTVKFSTDLIQIPMVIQISILIYLPLVAVIKIRKVGIRSILLLSVYAIFPFTATILTLNGFENYSYAAGAVSVLVIYILLQNEHITETRNYELKKENTIVEALSASYLNVYLVDRQSKMINIIKLDGYVTSGLETKNAFVYPYEQTCMTYIKNRVYSEDIPAVTEFMKWENIIKGVSEKQYYEFSYRVLEYGGIHHYQGRYRALEDNKFIVCAFQNIDAAVEAEEARNAELQKNLDIIKSLVQTYHSIYYVNMSDYSFIELGSIQQRIRSIIGEKGNSIDAMKAMCKYIIAPEYAEEMLEFSDLTTVNARLKDKLWISRQFYGVSGRWSEGYFIAAHRNKDGDCTNVIWAIRDIDESKRKEIAQQEILAAARESAEAANKAKTSFLFNMSHDIRTPMNAIMGFRDLLEKHQDEPEKRADYLKKIEEASNVLLSIINNVLEMARIEKGTLELNVSAWAADQFNNTLFSVFNEMMVQKGLTFTRSINVQHQYVYCDASKLREIFMNILSNAYKYTNAGGIVNMKLEEIPSDRKDYALYRTTISDTGIGMSEDFISKIYDEFAREKNTTDAKIEGTGLGMSIVKRLVELMEGTIEVHSKKGQGSTFIVTIPHKIAEKPDSMNSKENEQDVNPNIFKGKRILLAEDNELNAEIAKTILEEMEFSVDVAEDGQICLEKLKASEDGYYNLILMDIQMPNMNGYEAAKAIRKLENPLKAGIKIIAMTANAFEEDRQAAFKAGMNGHIAKPINIQELTGELTAALK